MTDQHTTVRSLVWFRADLRVQDNPALFEACEDPKDEVVAVFVICAQQWRAHDWADVKVEFLLRTLTELQRALGELNIPLLVESVETFRDVPDLMLRVARDHGCHGLLFNQEYELNEVRRDERIIDVFRSKGLEVRTFDDQTVVPPGELRTQADGFYTVFTPFRKRWIRYVDDDAPVQAGKRPRKRKRSGAVTSSGALPSSISGFDLSRSLEDLWPAGEREAHRRLRAFIAKQARSYDTDRDLPAVDGTSALSPYLTVGAISARQCVAAARDANDGRLEDGHPGLDIWIQELIWREFYRHVMACYPRVCMHRPFKGETARIRWRDDEDAFDAWCAGRTGVPIVDAGMRQLNETGWMHNRLRMITAMFLTKDLLIDWRRGERYFMRHLIDGDLASNNGGWQWSASTGTDAAPYFRIFNPYRQARRYDPDGVFIRRWVSELAGIEGDALQEPSRLPAQLRKALDYPEPIVDHAAARQRAIDAFKAVRS